MEEVISHKKWEGKVSTTLTKAKATQIWPLFKDFFNLHKWHTNLSTCYGIHGSNGEPGCIRYCSGFSLPSNDSVSWSKERLIAIDHANYSLSYEIVDCNIGFKSYVSTIRIYPGGGGGGGGGGVIEWSFVVDPVDGWRLEDLVSKYEAALHSIARKMEDAL